MLNSLFAQEQTQPVVEQGFTLTQPVATVLASSGVLLAALLAFVATWLGHRQSEKHFRLSNHRDRFTTVAGQLADPSAAVRIAGVYAMEALADDWLQYRWYTLPKKRKAVRHEAQTCINVLCSYVCLPYKPRGPEQTHTKTVIRYAPSDRVVEEHHEHRTEDSPVRQSIMRIIAAHLRPGARTSWSDFDFDFTGAYLENTDFAGCVFRGSAMFTRAQFHGETTSFNEAQFHSKMALFAQAQFHSKATSFDGAQFHSEYTRFDGTQFHSEYSRFDGTKFYGEETWFAEAQFHGERTLFEAQFYSTASFAKAQFYGEATSFGQSQFHGKATSFVRALFRRPVDFSHSKVRGNVVVDWQWPLPSGQVDQWSLLPSGEQGPAPVQPASVLPVDWPPVVASPSETVGAR